MDLRSVVCWLQKNSWKPQNKASDTKTSPTLGKELQPDCSPERAAVDFCLPGTSTTHCDVNKPPMHTEFLQELNRYMDSKYMVFNPINKALQLPKWTSRMKIPDGQLANWRPALTAAHSIPPFIPALFLPFHPPLHTTLSPQPRQTSFRGR